MTLFGPTSHHFISQRLRLHYSDWGNAGAPPLILVHGGRDHGRSWDWVAAQLRHDWHIIAPDLRGHGDSAWTADGNYDLAAMVYDLAQLVHQLDAGAVTIVAHSLGGNVALRFAALYPETVKKLVVIEGLGPSPAMQAKRDAVPLAERWRRSIEAKRRAAARQPRRYASLAEAGARMRAENSFLSAEQADHLTRHGAARNEDGSYSWKFDNHLNVWPVFDLPQTELDQLWAAIACPTLLLYGADSWASFPGDDGRLAHFKTAEAKLYDGAGHWLHHDQLDRFVTDLRAFL